MCVDPERDGRVIYLELLFEDEEEIGILRVNLWKGMTEFL